MLQSAVMNAFFSQCMIDLQFSSQIVNNEKDFEMNKILRKKLIQQKREFKEEVLNKMS